MQDLEGKIIPFEDKRFQRLSYILYNGINKEEYRFRQVFLNNIIEDFEKQNGELSWAQRSNILSQFETELFENYEHLKTLEDVMANLESDKGLVKKFKKEVSLEWIDSEVQRARKMFLMHTPEEVKKQREWVKQEAKTHRKFLEIGIN